MFPIVDLDRFTRRPGDGAADELGMQCHQMQRQPVDRQAERLKPATEAGDEARFIERVAFIAGEPFDDGEQRSRADGRAGGLRLEPVGIGSIDR